MPAVSYALTLDGSPAPAQLVDALQLVEVEDDADLADIMRVRVAIGVREDGSGWSVVDDGLFGRLQKIGITVTVGSGDAQPLLDAYVIESRGEFSNEPGHSVLAVVAMDPTVLMSLEEKVRAWPNMADSDIATSIFRDYGFTGDVEATGLTRQEEETTTTQRGTDIQFLRRLAERNGYECYVELDPRSGAVVGHFHPPRLDGQPQGVLTVNMGEATNVNSFAARFDMLRPTTARVSGVDGSALSEQPAQVEAPGLRDLGASATAARDRPRRVLLSGTGLADAGELQALAQAVVDRSSFAVVAEGEVSTAAYGGILRAKRTVMVRGAGQQFSGAYYVERVLHVLGDDGYVQRFTLRRNAVGVTAQDRFTDDGALP